jgi:hypothetical protein
MRRRQLFALLLVLSSIGFIPGIPSPLRAMCAFMQAFYLPGFVFILFFWDRSAPALDDLFVAPLFSATILSLLTAGAFALTHSLGTSVAISIVVLYGLLGVTLVLRNRFYAAGTGESKPFHIVVLVSLLFGGAVGALYLLNPYLLLRSDLLVHGPLVSEIVDRGIPPLEPRLPAAHVQYMWFYHLFVACFVKLSGVPVLKALAGSNLVYTIIFPYLVARVAVRYAVKHGRVLAAPLLAIAGLGSASWVLWTVSLLRAFGGEVRGHTEIVRILGKFDLNSYRVIYFLTPEWTYMVNMVDRFVTVSGFNYGINLFLLCFLLLLAEDFQKRAPFKAALCITVVIVGAFLCHIVTGVVLIAAALGTGVVLSLGRALRVWGRPSNFLALAVPAAGLIAAILCVPYFRSLKAIGGETIRLSENFHFGLRSLITIFAPFVPLVFLIKPLLKHLFGERTPERSVLVTWLVILLVFNAGINLPADAELKFALLFLLLLVMPVSIVLGDWLGSLRGPGRALAFVWIAILFVVPPVLTARGFLLDRPETEALRRAVMPSPDRMELYRWIQTGTNATSVIIELNTMNMTPLYAHRHSFLPPLSWANMDYYRGEKIEDYAAIEDEVFSEKPVSPWAIDYLRKLGLDFYVVIWTEELSAAPYLGAKFQTLEPVFREVYKNPAGEIYQFNRAAP